jgi:hypothetical protein
MTLTNTPTNAPRALQTPHHTTTQTRIQTQQTPQQTPCTHTPYNPQGVCMRLARAFYPPANPAALALRTCSQAPDRPDHQAIAEQDDRSQAPQIFGKGKLQRSRYPLIIPSSGRYSQARKGPQSKSRCVDIQHHAFRSIACGWQPGFAERVTDAFAPIVRTNTAANATTHQRPRHGFDAEPIATNDVLIESDQWVIGLRRATGNSGVTETVGGIQLGTVPQLAVRRARQTKRMDANCPALKSSARDPAGYAGGKKPEIADLFDLFLLHSGAPFQILGGLGLKKLGRPVLKIRVRLHE